MHSYIFFKNEQNQPNSSKLYTFSSASSITKIFFIATSDTRVQLGPLPYNYTARFTSLWAVSLQEPHFRFSCDLIRTGRHRYPSDLYTTLFTWHEFNLILPDIFSVLYDTLYAYRNDFLPSQDIVHHQPWYRIDSTTSRAASRWPLWSCAAAVR